MAQRSGRFSADDVVEPAEAPAVGRFSAADVAEVDAPPAAPVRPPPMVAYGVTDPSSVRVTPGLPPPPDPRIFEPASPPSRPVMSQDAPEIPPGAGAILGIPGWKQLGTGLAKLGRVSEQNDKALSPHLRDEALNSYSDVLDGAMGAATPLAIAGAIADLPGTALTIGSAWLGATAAQKASAYAGASPPVQRFLSTLAGAATALGFGGRQIANLKESAAKVATDIAAVADQVRADPSAGVSVKVGPFEVPIRKAGAPNDAVPPRPAGAGATPAAEAAAIATRPQIPAETANLPPEAPQAVPPVAPEAPVETAPVGKFSPEDVQEVAPGPRADEPREFASTQVSVPPAVAAKVEALAATIPDADLAEGGREADPHVTVKFGLHNDDPGPVAKLLADEPPITVNLGKTSVFPNGESGSGDVVKVDVDSPDLHRLNEKIASAVETTDTHPTYQPHVTLAYVKPGEGEKYAGDASLEGQSFTIDHVDLSTKDGQVISIPLGGAPPAEVANVETTPPIATSTPSLTPAVADALKRRKAYLDRELAKPQSAKALKDLKAQLADVTGKLAPVDNPAPPVAAPIAPPPAATPAHGVDWGIDVGLGPDDTLRTPGAEAPAGQAPTADMPAGSPSELVHAYIDRTGGGAVDAFRDQKGRTVAQVVKAAGYRDSKPTRQTQAGPPANKAQRRKNLLEWMTWNDAARAANRTLPTSSPSPTLEPSDAVSPPATPPVRQGARNRRAQRGLPDEARPAVEGAGEGGRLPRGGISQGEGRATLTDPDEIFRRQPPPVNKARIARPAVLRELVRIEDEMATFPKTDRTYTETPGKKDGNFGNGNTDMVPGVAGAEVYHDIVGESPRSPQSRTRSGRAPKKNVSRDRDQVLADIRDVLRTHDIKDHVQEGIVRVAEARADGTAKDKGLSRPWLPHADEALQPAPPELDAQVDALLDAMPESDLAPDEEGDISFDPSEFEPAMVDTLDTGEQQARLPGAEGARQAGKADTSFRAPTQATDETFSLSNEMTPAATAEAERAEAAKSPGMFDAPEPPAVVPEPAKEMSRHITIREESDKHGPYSVVKYGGSVAMVRDPAKVAKIRAVTTDDAERANIEVGRILSTESEAETQRREAREKKPEGPARVKDYAVDKGVQPYEVLEDQYIARRRETAITGLKRSVRLTQEEIDQLGPKAIKKRDELAANIKFWERSLAKLEEPGPHPSETAWKREYAETVKAAISKGKPVPPEVVAQRPEFTKAVDARARYDKGRHTSFANKSVAVDSSTAEAHGFKVKRQDGSPITGAQTQFIVKGMEEIQAVIGDVTDILRDLDPTIVHTNGKHPFMRGDAGGLYSSSDRSVIVGMQVFGQPVRALAHEVGHLLDISAGHAKRVRTRVRQGTSSTESESLAEADGHSDKLIRDATGTINDAMEVRRLVKAHVGEQKTDAEKAAVELAKVQLGPYWREPREVFARLFEQFVANGQQGATNAADSAADYARNPGWWTQAKFDEFKPRIEQAIKERIETLRENAKPKTDGPPSLRSERGAIDPRLLPGVAFVEDDVVPLAKKFGEVALEIRNAIAPQSATPESQRAADIVRRAKATSTNQATMEGHRYADLSRLAERAADTLKMRLPRRQLRRVIDGFAHATDDQNIQAMSDYERTGKFPGLPQAYNDLYRDSMTLSANLLEQAYGAIGRIENYVRHAFVFDSPADAERGMRIYQRTLSANRSPTKARILDLPIDEALDNMRARGINVRLATANPEAIRQWSLANAHRAAAFADAWAQMKRANLVTFVPMGDRPPADMVAISERGAAAFYPQERGLGTYHADANVARVLNNAVSQGFAGSPLVQGLKTINNSMNQLQLGVSAFHLGGSGFNAGVADVSLGMRRLLRGAMRGEHGTAVHGMVGIARGIVPFASFARDVYQGRAIINGLKANDPGMARFLEEQLNPAGARVAMDARFRNQMTKSMVDAYRRGNILGAGIRVPLAFVETAAGPLMEYAIPRVKLGVFMERAADIKARMPNATEAELHRAYAAAWDQIDNVFGQLVYDNGFWNRSAQDLAQLTTRSVGWTGGSLRWFVGAAADTGRLAKEAAKQATGQKGKPEVTDRIADALALAIVTATLGAIATYLLTGKGPSELKDYFYFKNGRTDPNGEPSRSAFPTYMKDVVSYGRAPLVTFGHKQSPLLNEAWQLYQNEDYWGTLIADPDDPAAKRWADRGRYLLEQNLPFTYTQNQRLNQEHASLGAKAATFFGVTKAPASVTRSDAEEYLHAIAPPMHRSKDQAVQAQERRDYLDAIRRTTPGEALPEVDTSHLSPAALSRLRQNAHKSYLETAINRPDVSIAQAFHAYELATEDERGAIRPAISKKKTAAMRSTPPDERQALQTTFEHLMTLPFTKLAAGF